MTTKTTGEKLDEALRALRRLGDPSEIAGFGDANDLRNDSQEMRARLNYARAKYRHISQAEDGEV